MYTLKITDENTVTTTVKETLVERSNYVDKLQIVVDKMYRDQIDMADTTAYMKYIMPVSKKIKMTQLIANDLEYEDDYIQYLVPMEAYLTAEAGDIEVSFSFYKLVTNEDDSVTSYVRKTLPGVIHISPLAAFDKYEPSEFLDEIDQRLLVLEARQKDIMALNEQLYEEMVRDIRLDKDNRKVTLTNIDGDTGNGFEVNDLSTMVAEDLVGVDPDGVQDGVVHLDDIPEMQISNLDNLLR